MSMIVSIVPMLFDLAVLTHILMEENRRATIMARREKGLITEEEAADLQLEIDSLRRSGCDIRSGSQVDTGGSDVIIHTDRGYDIGLRRNAKGAYDVVTHWSKQPGKAQIQQVQSDIQSLIKQKYAYEKVKRELAKKGFLISNEEVQADNSIRVVARKW